VLVKAHRGTPLYCGLKRRLKPLPPVPQGLMHNPKEEDVRAAILRHAGTADKEFADYTAAYAKTQPKPIFAQDEEEEEEEA
jgi:hypothetical protein